MLDFSLNVESNNVPARLPVRSLVDMRTEAFGPIGDNLKHGFELRVLNILVSLHE
jgi:hypothetical protein